MLIDNDELEQLLLPLSPLRSPSPDVGQLQPIVTEDTDRRSDHTTDHATETYGILVEPGSGDSHQAMVDISATVCELARRLTDQLMQHQGCCEHCHQQTKITHQEEYAEHVGLQQYLNEIQTRGFVSGRAEFP